jgi:hypothetical protein
LHCSRRYDRNLKKSGPNGRFMDRRVKRTGSFEGAR